MSNCNIDIGTMNDIDEMAKLYNNINDYLASGNNYPGWLKGIYPNKETAEIAIQEESLFVFRIEDKIAGSIILNHKYEKAYEQVVWGSNTDYDQIIVIHTLVVHPDFLKQGVSKKLMAFAKNYAQQKEMKAIRLDVTVQNIPAISLYEKCGYKYVGTVDLGLGYEHLKWFKLYELVL